MQTRLPALSRSHAIGGGPGQGQTAHYCWAVPVDVWWGARNGRELFSLGPLFAGYIIASREENMIFKPQIVARLWDTWLYYHDGTHYLFYLHRSRAGGGGYDGMSVATADDGVHFDDRGPIIHKAKDANWLGTGMVWRAGDQFMLNFSEERSGVQEIFFAESDDLLHWRRLPDEEYVCRSDPRWYAESPTFTKQRWDCIWVLPRDDGPGYIGFLTAVAKDGPPGLCGTAGCVVSADGRLL